MISRRTLLARLVAGDWHPFTDAYFDDYYRDLALAGASSGSTFLVYLNSAEPDTYTEASSTFVVGSKTGPSLSVVAGTPTGRAARCAAFSNGIVSADSSAAYWSIVDSVAPRLVAAGALAEVQTVYAGNTWGLALFDYVTLPGAQS